MLTADTGPHGDGQKTSSSPCQIHYSDGSKKLNSVTFYDIETHSKINGTVSIFVFFQCASMLFKDNSGESCGDVISIPK